MEWVRDDRLRRKEKRQEPGILYGGGPSRLAKLDSQSIPKSLLEVPEVTISCRTLLTFRLVTAQAGSQRVQNQTSATINRALTSEKL